MWKRTVQECHCARLCHRAKSQSVRKTTKKVKSWWKLLLMAASVSNGSNPLERFRVRVGTGTEPWQRFYHMKHPDRWHLGWFPPQNPAFASPDVSLQLSIWVLIVSWHDVYADCAVSAARAPPAFRFAIRPIFVESLSKTRKFRWKSTLIWQPLNEYQLDLNSECGRWKIGLNCTIYVYIMSWYDQNSNT